MSNKAIKLFKDYIVITLAVIIMDLGIYAFKFPNHFSFGGVSGLAVVLNEILGISAAQINLVINLALLVIGFAVLGKSFGLKTAYATVLSSVVLSLMEKMMPISAPLTNQPMLELAYAIALPAVAAAMLFYVDASGGGTDIVAMILKKYTTIDIGTALLISDVAIVALSFIRCTYRFVLSMWTAGKINLRRSYDGSDASVQVFYDHQFRSGTNLRFYSECIKQKYHSLQCRGRLFS